MKMIPLNKGKFTLVDDADFDWLNQWKWKAKCANNSTTLFYAERKKHTSGNRKVTIRMHRLILGLTDPKIEGDHRDGDGLNNQRHNLRVATRKQNGANRKVQVHSSCFKGVYFCKEKKRWRAQIRVNGKRIRLGKFRNPVDAAKNTTPLLSNTSANLPEPMHSLAS